MLESTTYTKGKHSRVLFEDWVSKNKDQAFWPVAGHKTNEIGADETIQSS